MSALLHIKNLIVGSLTLETDVKKEVMNVLNSIDKDLDEYGYVTSYQTDKCIADLNSAIIGEEKIAELIAITKEEKKKPSFLERDVLAESEEE